MAQIPIKRSIERIPGGMMIVPLVIGVLFKTFWPEAIQIGGFTTAIANGALCLIGVFFACMGAGISLKVAPKALKRGAVIAVTKVLVGVAIGLAVDKLCGTDGFFGLSAMAIIAAMTNANCGLYAGLTTEFGDETDVAALGIVSLTDGPFFTLIALCSVGMLSLPLTSLLGLILPMIVGMVIGNLDEEMRDFLTKGCMMLIPFFAFGLGFALSFQTLIQAGLSGVLLGVMTTVIGGIFTILADKATGGSGVAGAAIATTAGNAVATPPAIALTNPALSGMAAVATPQVAASIITATLLTPILTAIVKKLNDRRDRQHLPFEKAEPSHAK